MKFIYLTVFLVLVFRVNSNMMEDDMGDSDMTSSSGGYGGGYERKQVYSQPKPAYQAPRQEYQAPRPAYQAPRQEYQAPKPAYQAPKQEYSQQAY